MLWKDIVGYEGLYMVSDDGRIFSWRSSSIMKPVLRSSSKYQTYYRNGLTKDDKETKYAIHRLVAEAFLPNPENKSLVDHINGNTLDNRVENLRWATAQENCRNCALYSNNLLGIKGVGKNGNRYVARCRVNGKMALHKTYDTAEEASEAYRQFASTAFGQFFKN